MKRKVLLALIVIIAFGTIGAYFYLRPTEIKVLVFSKTEGFRHSSIEEGVAAIRRLGQANDFSVEATEDATFFDESRLKDFKVVLFLNTTGDVLDPMQQVHLERFIQGGGGFVGIHAAADTEYGWPWYGKLVGAYFESHPMDPNVQEAIVNVTTLNHQSTEKISRPWKVSDEWYNYRNLDPDNKVVLTIDESTYSGGSHGNNHPIAWFKEFDGGKSFYTGLGHTAAQFENPIFLDHLLGGIRYAIGLGLPIDYTRSYSELMPEENRFVRTTFRQNLNEPMELDFLDQNRLLYIERRGDLHLFDLIQGKDTVLATLDVFSELEDGLLGLAVDPNYAKNHWIYLYYSENKGEPLQNLSRFELVGDALDLTSEKILLQIPTQREECCHSAGSIEFGPDGLLYLSTGDNTSPRADGYAPLDHRKGRQPWDAQKSSANTNDLRGKILRIRPEENGTYTIPDGNLFKPGLPKTRPEIFVMGNRNPYRISIDAKTGYLYWGEVGPDASDDSIGLGPRGYDEINQAKKAGNYGWPLFTGNNTAYNARNYEANTTGEAFDSLAPRNTSPNNTGLVELPPAQRAMIYYPYASSNEFPVLGSGARNAMVGPIYYHEYHKDGPRSWPEYFDGKLLAYDFMRNSIFAITFENDAELERITRILPNAKFNSIIDMAFGPDGAMYFLEYGTGWFTQNPNATLSRFDFIRGNRAPRAEITADKTIGAHPLHVAFSSRNAIDFDGDPLSYSWTFTGDESTTEANPTFTFDKSGRYIVKLKVDDGQGNASVAQTEIVVGNELPELSWKILDGNSSFYWPEETLELRYQIEVSDAEDGSLAEGTIDPKRVMVSFDYLPEGSDEASAVPGHYASGHPGLDLVSQSDCNSCHKVEGPSIGPAYKDVAERYGQVEGAAGILADKIIHGGSGNWGEVIMAAHPDISEREARLMANYILSLSPMSGQQKATYPISGTFNSDAHLSSNTAGTYLLKASYTDNGGGKIEGLTAQKTIYLRSPRLEAEHYDEGSANRMDLTAGIAPGIDEDMGIVIGMNDSYMMYQGLDMRDISGVNGRFAVAKGILSGGQVEFRLDAIEGALLGSISIEIGLLDFGFREFALRFDRSVSGLHDLYIVFRSEDKDESAVVTAADWISFLRDPIN